MIYVVKLADCRPDLVATTGGKAVGLGQLVRHGLAVPDGVVLTTAAYRDCVPAPLRERIAGLAGSAHTHAELQAASEEIRALFTEDLLSDAVRSEIHAAYDALGGEEADRSAWVCDRREDDDGDECRAPWCRGGYRSPRAPARRKVELSGLLAGARTAAVDRASPGPGAADSVVVQHPAVARDGDQRRGDRAVPHRAVGAGRRGSARPGLRIPRALRGPIRRPAQGDRLAALRVRRGRAGDRAASAVQAARNFSLFDAPHAAVVTTDADLGVYGAVDCGLYIETFLLAAQSLGLGAIPQAALAAHGSFLREFFDLPEDRRVVCGISFGWPDHDHPANGFRTRRAETAETVTWVD